MHLNKSNGEKLSATQSIALLGVLAALSLVSLVLGSVVVVNTLFFTALAAFFVGVAIISCGISRGVVFFFVCTLLDFLFNPNKLHVLLYVIFAIYILVAEISWKLMKGDDSKEAKFSPVQRKKRILHFFIRLIVYSILYIPAAWFFPQLIFSEKILQSTFVIAIMIGGGIAAFIIYDLAYLSWKRFYFTIIKNIK